ncbi:unnamed protein product [Mytilus coruscus]|uniref:Integrase core domain-containing protein n=1 Tax=Mytilus coruscus TaxID=42192 RepID=A0A6J8BZI6_MYTCO|nr:unnamed protein product [Mytilus coruscus]
MEQRNNLIEMYYTLRLTFDEIKYILAKKHKVVISTRQLKRIVASLGLYRRRSRNNLFDVATFISKELKVSGQQHGYRWIHTKCLERGLEIDKESVRLIIKCLDLTGVKCRNARKLTRRTYMNNGPNYIWHMDGYDKLKPYGICIHGCIDGFSRNIIWLEADTTNKDPYVIAGYFIDTVREVGGCPRCIRADLGTENGIVRELQVPYETVMAMKQTHFFMVQVNVINGLKAGGIFYEKKVLSFGWICFKLLKTMVISVGTFLM